MKGSIRLIVGLLVAFGAVGEIDYNPQADLLLQTAIAAVGLLIMASGARAMKGNF